MLCSYFLDVPVYRVNSERYYQEMDAYVNKNLLGDSENIEQKKRFFRENPDIESQYRQYYQNKYGGAWNYNEIVGYIQLHFLGTQIRGEYWGLTSKRIIRTRKKVFEWKTHKLAYELNIPKNSSNSYIFEKISAYLALCQKELKDNYIDTKHFEVIGPHINWASLLLKC